MTARPDRVTPEQATTTNTNTDTADAGILTATAGAAPGANAGGARVGYARVSTIDQTADLQHDALTAAGAVRVFTDTASGAATVRPQLTAALDYVRAGDTLMVWRLDRLGRSLPDLIAKIADLEAAGVEFISLTEGIDTTTASGRLLFHMMGALAEFERSLIRERTRSGLAAARARGRVGGRPSVMTPARVELVRALAPDNTYDQIAAQLGISRATVSRALAGAYDNPTADKPPR